MMRITTKPGEMIVFIGRNGTDYDLERARGVLTPGRSYTVKKTVIGGFRSTVEIEEHPGKEFNTVMFTNEDLKGLEGF